MVCFINNVAQLIIMTRGCVANKKHVASLKVKFIDHTQTLFIGYNESLLYPAHNFVLHAGILKLWSKTPVPCKDRVVSLKAKASFRLML